MVERDDSGHPTGHVRRSVTDLASALAVIEQLEQAVVSNRVISMAVGVLMERHHVDASAAIRELRKTSNDLNLKLAHVAAAVVDAANASPGTDTALRTVQQPDGSPT